MMALEKLMRLRVITKDEQLGKNRQRSEKKWAVHIQLREYLLVNSQG